MNKKTYVKLGVTLALLGGAFLVYNRYFNKSRFIKMIVSKVPTASESALKSADLGYVRGRAFGLKNGYATFTFKGKKYNTNDGRASK